MYDMDDFKNIDIQEELADMEAPDMRSAGDLLERTLDRRDELDEGIDLPWSKSTVIFGCARASSCCSVDTQDISKARSPARSAATRCGMAARLASAAWSSKGRCDRAVRRD